MTPSQKASEMIRRIMDDSDNHPSDTEEFLKQLAIASTASGEGVEKALVASRATDQARIAESRIVVEEGGKFDFTLAIFREWFAARALVEGSVTLDDIELNSDRWIVPLAIAINSENPNMGSEIMERLACRDPGMASLVLEEVKHSWSTEESIDSGPPGTALEIGTRIRNAMEDWREGLGPLMPILNKLDESGNVRTLGIDENSGWVTTSWYDGSESLPPVVQLPEDLHDLDKGHFWSWPGWTSRGIEPTNVWPWSFAHNELFRSLSEQLKSFRLALESQEGFHEFAYELFSYLRRRYFEARDLQTPTEVIAYIEHELLRYGKDPRASITFGYTEYSFTIPKLEAFREKVSELSCNGIDVLVDPWSGPDKPWPKGKTWGMWFDVYSEERLLQRTNEVLNGALRIYNDITERWLPAFNRRGQLSHALPFRMRGEIRLHRDQQLGGWKDYATLVYWTEEAHDDTDSGVFIELEPKRQSTGDESPEQRIPHRSGWRILPGNGPKPATKLAHEWLTNDLYAMHWARR